MLGIGNYIFRLIPSNPILLRVVESGGKRKRDLFIRCAYLGILVLLVMFRLLPELGDLDGSLSKLTSKSAAIFHLMSYVQLGLVALLAPVFTAGAITQEKDSQTYDILLSTPLTNAQIVLGSLLSRLFFVVTLLLSGIPVFAITQIFGGVAINQIVVSWLIACATAFITGSVAMAIACLKVGTRRTIFTFYLVILIYLAVPIVIDQLGYCRYEWKSGPNSTSYISKFAGVHPFLALRGVFGETEYQPPPAGMVAGYSWPINWYLSSPHTFYVSLMFFLSFVLVTPSILLLRRLAQSTTTAQMWLLQLLRLSRGNNTRKPRYVWSNPIAWREAKTKASANRAVVMRYGFMLLGLGAAFTLVMLSGRTVTPAKSLAFGYNAQAKTISVLEDDRPVIYRVRAPGDSGGPATVIKFGDQTLQLEDLRAGMAVKSDGPLVKDHFVTHMTVSYPDLVLPQDKIRQFLLGAMIIELAIIMLILTQNAASTVTREKEDGTLDLLLSTPITSRYYIWGKLRGLVSFVLPLAAVPLVSILMFVVYDMFRSTPWALHPPDWTVLPESLLVLPGTLVMVTAFAAILGMQMSLRCRKTIMAVMSSVGIVAGVFGTLWVCGLNAAASRNLSEVGVGIGCFSPFTLMALFVAPLDNTGGNFIDYNALLTARVVIFIFGWMATGVLGVVVWTMYKSMVHNFDMTIRKQST
ncbi:MAG: ABC transporter permease subunit [Tepidisphaeraceae bacterium]|jgi:ABC-type transport system involved in multi-copper enzyme maturation permease subunit